ncbi:MAG: hypothetical protein ABI743_04315 [bacterium]
MIAARHLILAALAAALLSGATACEAVSSGQNDPPDILSIRATVGTTETPIELEGQTIDILSDISGPVGGAHSYDLDPVRNTILFTVYVQVNNVNEEFQADAVLTHLSGDNPFGGGDPPGGLAVSVTKTIGFTQPGSAKGVLKFKVLIQQPESIAEGRDTSIELCDGGRLDYVYRFDFLVANASELSDAASANVTFSDNTRIITRTSNLCN